MNVYLYHDNQQLGPYTLDTVHQMLNTGSVPSTALVWFDGAADWMSVGDFLAQHPNPKPVPIPVPRLAAAAPVIETPARSESSVLLRTFGAALLVAVASGAAWAAFQCFANIQLPYVFGVGIGWLCGYTVDKVSGGMAGMLYVAIAIVACLLGWAIGLFGVVFGGYYPLVSIWTIICFIFALGTAWKAAAE